MDPALAANLYHQSLAAGLLAMAVAEINPLSEDEVRLHLENRLQVIPSRRQMVQEIENLAEADRLMTAEARTGAAFLLSVERLCELNRLVLKNLPSNPGAGPGEIRVHDTEAARFRGAPAAECRFLLDRLCQWLNGPRFQGNPRLALVFATIKAVLAHLYVLWIRPFGDGNGRTARLVQAQLLLAGGIPAAAVHLMSCHYHRTRSEYDRQLEAATRSGGDVAPFLSYAVQGFCRGLQEQVNQVSGQQWGAAWRDLVNQVFPPQPKAINERRRLLLLDLSVRNQPCRVGELPELSPRVARVFAGCGYRTLLRDLRFLSAEGWITVENGECAVNRKRILPFRQAAGPGTNPL